MEHGGRGLSAAYQAILDEECALAYAPDSAAVIGLTVAGPAIIRYGTRSQQSRFLPRILSGETLFCLGLTEPEGGSDLTAVRLSASPDPRGYRLDGVKIWSSHADLADYCLAVARTAPGGPGGLTCFLVDMRSPGMQVRPLRHVSGDTDFSQIVFSDVRTPAVSVLGPMGDGGPVALRALARERHAFAIGQVARLSAVFDRLRQTAATVGADRDPALRRELAAHYVRLQALRHTGQRSVATVDRTGEPGPEASVLELRWAEAYRRMTATGVRLLGPHGALDSPNALGNGYWQRERLRSAAAPVEGAAAEILRFLVAEPAADRPAIPPARRAVPPWTSH